MASFPSTYWIQICHVRVSFPSVHIPASRHQSLMPAPRRRASHSPPLVMTLFPPPLLWGCMSSEERDLFETFHLEPSVPIFLTLCILSNCGSLYVAFVPQEKAWWLSEALIYEDSRISFGVILLLCFFFISFFLLPPLSLPPSLPLSFSFFQTVVFGFAVGL